MASLAKRCATYDDLLQVPDHQVAEILNGELHVSPRPASRHATAATGLGSQVREAFHRGHGGPGGWWILFEPELHLGQDVLVPDLAGWRRERMPEFPDTPAFTLVPDWVCEVVSSSTERLDRAKKLPVYARQGVGYCWLVNPATRTIESYRLAEGRWLLLATHEGPGPSRIEPFDAVELDLAALWGD